MNTQKTLEQLRSLRLTGMARRYEAAIALPAHEIMEPHSLVSIITQAEVEYREQSRTQKFLKASKLRYNALPEEIICNPERGITREQILRLSDGAFIDLAQNVLITGSTGTGKSFAACALGRSACLLGYRTLYFGMSKFLETLAQARLEGTYLKWLKSMSTIKLLIFDDFGLKEFNSDARIALLDILEDRYGIGSTMITSQVPVENWHSLFKDKTHGDAILDRLTGGAAHRIELKGKSMRIKKNY